MKVKKIIAAAAVCALAAGAFAGCGCLKTDNGLEKPVFMYYISNSDENFDETNQVLAELEEEYSDRMDFSIVNIDDDNVQALVSAGQTPAMIIIDEENESQIEYNCNDKEQLKEYIEKALN